MQIWYAEDVLNIRGVPSNPVPGVGGDHVPGEVGGSRHAERGEDEHAPAQELEKYDNQPTVAEPHRTSESMELQTDVPDARRSKQADQCHTTMNAERG